MKIVQHGTILRTSSHCRWCDSAMRDAVALSVIARHSVTTCILPIGTCQCAGDLQVTEFFT
jgi:hypothetical protein